MPQIFGLKTSNTDRPLGESRHHIWRIPPFCVPKGAAIRIFQYWYAFAKHVRVEEGWLKNDLEPYLG